MFNDIAHFERNSTEAYTDNIGGVTFIGTFVLLCTNVAIVNIACMYICIAQFYIYNERFS